MFYIMYNPLSKSGKDPKSLKKVEKYLSKIGEDYSFLDIIDVANNKEKYVEMIHRTDKVLIVGGDGTLHFFADAIRSITTNGMKIYLFRGGTGNDFGREFKEKLIDITDILMDIPTFTIKKEEAFLNCTGFGIDGEVCAMVDGDSKAKKGLNYFKSAVKLFKNFKQFDLEATVDGTLYRFKKVWFATIMNGKYFGGGMKLNPKGDRFDKEMELWVIHDAKMLQVLLIFPLIFLGKHNLFKKVGVDCIKGNQFHLKASSPQILETDGEVRKDVLEFSSKR